MSLIQNKFSEVETNIDGGIEFKVTANGAHIFALLSDTLYSNKEVAVIHEISANAVDAHKLVGKENVPIKVTGPTMLEPSLSIRDYGPGLTEEHVNTLLTTYGESGVHKRKSNEYFGCWGVGAKSPAAITSSWKIISYHAEEKITYIVVIQSNGVPKLNKIKTEKTTETGLEVIIPIDPSRISIWNSALENAYSDYTVKPKTNFNIRPDNLKPPTAFSSRDVLLSRNSLLSCIINNRRYVIDTDALLSQDDSQFYTKFFHQSLNFVIKFNTGEIALDMSREKIQYNHHSVTAILSRMKEIHADIKREFDEIESSVKSSLEYRIMIKQKLNEFIRDGIYNDGSLFSTFAGNNKFGIDDAKYLSMYNIGLNVAQCIFKSAKKTRVTKPPSGKCYYRTWSPMSSICALPPQKNDGSLEKFKVFVYIAEMNNLIIAEKTQRNTMARVANAYPDKDVILVEKDDFDTLPDELNFIKIRGDDLPDLPTKQKHVTEKIDTKIYGRVKNGYTRVDINKIPSIKKCFFHVVNNVVSFDSIAKSERIDIQLLEKIGYNALFVKDKSYIPSGYMTTDEALKFERSLWTPDIIEKVLFFDFFYHRRSMPIINSLRGIDSTLVNDGMYKETLLDYNNMAAAIGPVHPVFEFELRTETYMSLFGTRLFSDEYRKLAFFDRYPMLMYNISNSVMAMKPEHIIAYVNLIDVK